MKELRNEERRKIIGRRETREAFEKKYGFGGEAGKELREAYAAYKKLLPPPDRKDREAYQQWRQRPEVRRYLRIKYSLEILVGHQKVTRDEIAEMKLADMPYFKDVKN